LHGFFEGGFTMLGTSKLQRRRGTTAVECAFVYPVIFFLMLALFVGGMGVFRYVEMAALARHASRYASTHGANFRKDTGAGIGTPGTAAGSTDGKFWYRADPMATSGADSSWTGDIYDSSVRDQLVLLDPQSLTCKVGWPPVINQPDKPDNWPGATVTVTINYDWMPEVFLVGPITLSSTSSMPITN